MKHTLHRINFYKCSTMVHLFFVNAFVFDTKLMIWTCGLMIFFLLVNLSWTHHPEPATSRNPFFLAWSNNFLSSSWFNLWGTPREPVPFFFAGLPQLIFSTSCTVGRQHFVLVFHIMPPDVVSVMTDSLAYRQLLERSDRSGLLKDAFDVTTWNALVHLIENITNGRQHEKSTCSDEKVIIFKLQIRYGQTFKLPEIAILKTLVIWVDIIG